MPYDRLMIDSSKELLEPFERRLLVARDQRRIAQGATYIRVVLLNEVFMDRGFRSHLAHEIIGRPLGLTPADDLDVGEVLDAEVADLGFRFLELRKILETFPRRSDWETRLLRDMHEMSIPPSP